MLQCWLLGSMTARLKALRSVCSDVQYVIYIMIKVFISRYDIESLYRDISLSLNFRIKCTQDVIVHCTFFLINEFAMLYANHVTLSHLRSKEPPRLHFLCRM